MLTDEMRAEGWLPHDGGPCPVTRDSKPGVMFGDGYTVAPGRQKAEYWLVGYWSHHWPAERIIAYKPENPDGNQ